MRTIDDYSMELKYEVVTVSLKKGCGAGHRYRSGYGWGRGQSTIGVRTATDMVQITVVLTSKGAL